MNTVTALAFQKVCRVCNHAVSKVGVMPSGWCGVHRCQGRGWHYHCLGGHSVCTTEGCYPDPPLEDE